MANNNHPDPMEVDAQPVAQFNPRHENEKVIFMRHRRKQETRNVLRPCGTVIQPYQFTCSDNDLNLNGQKEGHVYFSNQMKEIKFLGEDGFNSTKVHERDASFMVGDPSVDQLVDPLNPMGHPHIGILKSYGAAYNLQIKKTLKAFAKFGSVTPWITTSRPPQIPNQRLFIPSDLRDNIRNLYEAMVYLWKNDYKVHGLRNISNYGVNNEMIKFQSQIGAKEPNDTMETLRSDFASMLQNTVLAAYGSDIELSHFIQLLQNTRASEEDILGHPMLANSHARERMYEEYHEQHLALSQYKKNWLNSHVGTPGWQNTVSKNSGLQKIMIYQQGQIGGGFSVTSCSGALHFAKVSVGHYHQHCPHMRHELDALLRIHLAGVLTGIYGAKFNQAYLQEPS